MENLTINNGWMLYLTNMEFSYKMKEKRKTQVYHRSRAEKTFQTKAMLKIMKTTFKTRVM